MPIAKSKRSEAERAAEHVLIEIFRCVHTRRAIKTKYQKVDFFGCDVMGKRDDGSMVWAQVTAGGHEATRVRRKKLKSYSWAEDDQVLVLRLVETQDPGKPKRKLWHFRVYRLRRILGEDWVWSAGDEVIEIKKEWFRAYKEA